MAFHLPTKEECDIICSTTEAFYMIERFVESQNVVVVDYRLASASDFFPLDENNRTELRGLCFVQQEDGTWERNILMQKFFNINQSSGANGSLSWMEEDVKHKKIVAISNKEDGSIISFVQFANGRFRAKSKTSFDSDQARMAQEVFDNSTKLQDFVVACQKLGYVPIFELCSPENQIVLEYQKTELILLQIRKLDGEYVKRNILGVRSDEYGIALARTYSIEVLEEIASAYISYEVIDKIGKLKFKTFMDMIEFLDENKNSDGTDTPMSVLDLILLSREYVDDQEGEVLMFEDGQMAKVKNVKYLSLHGLIGPDAFRENLLIKTILDGNIDDVIAASVPGEKKDKIIAIDEKVNHYFNHLVVEYKELRRKFFQDFKEDRKAFAIKHSKHPMFSYVMKTLNESFRDVEPVAEAQVKQHIEKCTNSLGKAKEWLDSLNTSSF